MRQIIPYRYKYVRMKNMSGLSSCFLFCGFFVQDNINMVISSCDFKMKTNKSNSNFENEFTWVGFENENRNEREDDMIRKNMDATSNVFIVWESVEI
ncbi:hypothetical protein LXL04_014677 [Taraxacum kok-saghyz]